MLPTQPEKLVSDFEQAIQRGNSTEIATCRQNLILALRVNAGLDPRRVADVVVKALRPHAGLGTGKLNSYLVEGIARKVAETLQTMNGFRP